MEYNNTCWQKQKKTKQFKYLQIFYIITHTHLTPCIWWHMNRTPLKKWTLKQQNM